MKTTRIAKFILVGLVLCFTTSLHAQVPQLINYQGRVVVGTTNFNGTGSFKFALVDPKGQTTYWSNDGTSSAGSEPTNAVSLTVSNGLYSVLLGDVSLANMTAIPSSVFGNSDVRLRIWFNDGPHGSQLLTPDQRIAAVGYAQFAANVPDGAISGAKIASATITSSNIANGAIGTPQLGNGAVTGTNIANAAVGSANIATGAVGNPQLANGAVTSPKITVPLSLSGSVASGTAIITGNSSSGNGNGVEGDSLNLYGVIGISTNDTGVYGHGATYGVYGFGNSIGVYGIGPTGVYGTSSNGKAILGLATSAGPNIAGVWGENNANGGTGVVGKATASSGTGVFGSGASNGLDGRSTTSSGTGVNGVGGTYGVQGNGDTYGVFGKTNNGVAGVRGENSAIGVGVYGVATNQPGHGIGVEGSGGDVGVLGFGNSGGVAGILGVVNGATWAGYFDGNVNVTGTISKSGGSFKIDHPLDPANKYLSHSFVESPDMKNIYDGVATLDRNGEAVIQLPDWFGALNKDFRYQLTAIGAPGPNLYIAAKIENNQFKIAGGQPGMEVSWMVTGIRQDAYANAHRIPVEQDKTGDERGKYTFPELFGQPADRKIGALQPAAKVPQAKAVAVKSER